MPVAPVSVASKFGAVVSNFAGMVYDLRGDVKLVVDRIAVFGHTVENEARRFDTRSNTPPASRVVASRPCRPSRPLLIARTMRWCAVWPETSVPWDRARQPPK